MLGKEGGERTMEETMVPRFRCTWKAERLAVAAAIMGELSKQLRVDGKKFRVTIDCDPETNRLEIIRQDFIQSA